MITYNGISFEVTYALVARVSLTEQGNKSDEDCAKERQVYVYVSADPNLGAPITDLKMSNWFNYGDFDPVVTMDDRPFISVYLENEDDIFVDSDYFMYGNQLSFRREGEMKPYVSKLMVSSHGDGGEEAIAKLLEAGYTDIVSKELNENAGGNYIYLGMKRTADINDAVYDIMLTNNAKKPVSSINEFTLVSTIDLNEDAGGKYIYLYEKRTPYRLGELPLYDIIIGGKNHEDYSFEDGGRQFFTKAAENQDGDMQDVNQKAGGDYIYLLKVKELQLLANTDTSIFPHLASIFSSGSIIVIGIVLVAAAIVGGYVFYRKKHHASVDETENEK